MDKELECDELAREAKFWALAEKGDMEREERKLFGAPEPSTDFDNDLMPF